MMYQSFVTFNRSKQWSASHVSQCGDSIVPTWATNKGIGKVWFDISPPAIKAPRWLVCLCKIDLDCNSFIWLLASREGRGYSRAVTPIPLNQLSTQRYTPCLECWGVLFLQWPVPDENKKDSSIGVRYQRTPHRSLHWNLAKFEFTNQYRYRYVLRERHSVRGGMTCTLEIAAVVKSKVKVKERSRTQERSRLLWAYQELDDYA